MNCQFFDGPIKTYFPKFIIKLFKKKNFTTGISANSTIITDIYCEQLNRIANKV